MFSQRIFLSRFPEIIMRVLLACLLLQAATACTNTGNEDSHDSIIRADLLEIIEQQQRTCAEVVRFEVDDRLDFRVECSSGDRYRIHVGAEGHVNVAPATDSETRG